MFTVIDSVSSIPETRVPRTMCTMLLYDDNVVPNGGKPQLTSQSGPIA